MSNRGTITATLVGKLLAALAKRCDILSLNYRRSTGSRITVEFFADASHKRRCGQVVAYSNICPDTPPLHLEIGRRRFDLNSPDELDDLKELKSRRAFAACFIGSRAA